MPHKELILPWSSGVRRGLDSEIEDRADTRYMRVSAATRLVDLAEDFSFYHSGVLHCCCPLNYRDPRVDCASELGIEIKPHVLKFDKEVFSGFEQSGGKDWNYQLELLDKESFRQYLGWLGTLSLANFSSRHLYRVRYKELAIPDPLFLQKAMIAPDPATAPRVTVTALCLDTNRGCAYFDYDEKGYKPPRLTFSDRTFPDTMLLSEKLFAGNSSPLDTSVDQLRSELSERVKQARDIDDRD